jgi:hypothetical protein
VEVHGQEVPYAQSTVKRVRTDFLGLKGGGSTEGERELLRRTRTTSTGAAPLGRRLCRWIPAGRGAGDDARWGVSPVYQPAAAARLR